MTDVTGYFYNNTYAMGVYELDNSRDCGHRGFICVPRGDDARIVFDVFDEDEDEYDLMGSQEIVFVVAHGRDFGGVTMHSGFPVYIVKRLSSAGISILPSMYQFAVNLTSAETKELPAAHLYYEARVTNATGRSRTVSMGNFHSTPTMIKDIPA